jgi:hypothetical protein
MDQTLLSELILPMTVEHSQEQSRS